MGRPTDYAPANQGGARYDGNGIQPTASNRGGKSTYRPLCWRNWAPNYRLTMTTSSIAQRGRHKAEISRPKKGWQPFVGLGVFVIVAVGFVLAFTIR